MNQSKRRTQSKRELRELQKLMAAAVMRPLAHGDSMQRKWDDGRSAEKVVRGFIKPNDRLNSLERLEVYNRQYWFRLRACFYADYPGLHAILGEKKFSRFTDAYLAKFPSRSFTVRNLGSRLAEFIEAAPELTAPHQQLALDVAQVEWAYLDAFDNEARPALTADDLAAFDLAKSRLHLQPYLTLLKLENDIADFLIEIKKDAGLRNEASNAMEPGQHRQKAHLVRKIKRETNFLAVHRHQDSIYYKRLEPGQFIVLSALQEGATLEKACAKLAGLKIPGDMGATIQQWFAATAALGWFCKLTPQANGER